MKSAETLARVPDTHSNKKQKIETPSVKKRSKTSREDPEIGISDPDFESLVKELEDHVSLDEIREMLRANEQEIAGSFEELIERCADQMLYGPLERCDLCDGGLEFSGFSYKCNLGFISEWSKCGYSTTIAPRKKQQAWIVPNSVSNKFLSQWSKKQKDPSQRPVRQIPTATKPFFGTIIALSGRLSRPQYAWREEIEKNGGTVVNVIRDGVSYVVVSGRDRERLVSSRVVAEAIKKGIPVVRQSWLRDSIEKQQIQPVDAYDIRSELTGGHEVPFSSQVEDVEISQLLMAELKLNGKRGVHKDSRLKDQGGFILERDNILYNCAFSMCDQALGVNDYCVMQLIGTTKGSVYLYMKKGRVGDPTGTEEQLDEMTNVEEAIDEFVNLFQELTGNEFEPWERKKIFAKKYLKFNPIDMAEGVDVRYGGLGVRQLGIATARTKLHPKVAEICKIVFGQEVYRIAMTEMAINTPELPTGNVTDVHLKRCHEVLMEFAEYLGRKEVESKKQHEAMCLDLSNKWFSLLYSTRPFVIHDMYHLAGVAAPTLEAVRDISFASQVIGDMSATLDDPLGDRYSRLNCFIIPLDKDHSDYGMILNYFEKTYEPIQIRNESFGVAVDSIFALEGSGPTYKEMAKMPNKVLLWCGTRTSNLVRHLKKGFLPAAISAPAPGYMFGRGIYSSDAAAKAAMYGFNRVERPEGFLILAVVSQGDMVIEMSKPPEDTTELERKKVVVKGLGRKTTKESEYITWKDKIKVPCGSLIPSGLDDSPLAYNEYVVYDPKQVKMMFLVRVRLYKSQ